MHARCCCCVIWFDRARLIWFQCICASASGEHSLRCSSMPRGRLRLACQSPRIESTRSCYLSSAYVTGCLCACCCRMCAFRPTPDRVYQMPIASSSSSRHYRHMEVMMIRIRTSLIISLHWRGQFSLSHHSPVPHLSCDTLSNYPMRIRTHTNSDRAIGNTCAAPPPLERWCYWNRIMVSAACADHECIQPESTWSLANTART